MKFQHLIMAAILSGYSLSGFAIANNCNQYQGKTGTVSSVMVGVDGSESINISFKFRYNGATSSDISVKPTLNDASGRGIYLLLLTAYKAQTPFKITRCYSNQLAGGEVTY